MATAQHQSPARCGNTKCAADVLCSEDRHAPPAKKKKQDEEEEEEEDLNDANYDEVWIFFCAAPVSTSISQQFL